MICNCWLKNAFLKKQDRFFVFYARTVLTIEGFFTNINIKNNLVRCLDTSTWRLEVACIRIVQLMYA